MNESSHAHRASVMKKISLIVGTVGRIESIHDLLQSLVNQEISDRIEVILVDQNGDTRLSEIFEQYSTKLNIRWIASAIGLSRARNAGLRVAEHDGIVGFPDDDCQYPEHFLMGLMKRFERTGADFLSVLEVDEKGQTDTRPLRHMASIHRYNVWRACGSNRTFYTRAAIDAIGEFDETLGLGAGTFWEGGEDIDYPIRALEKGLHGRFDPSLHVVHKSSIAGGYGNDARRTYAYNTAMGRIWRQHGYPLWWLAYQSSRALGGLLIGVSKADPLRVHHYWGSLRGRLAGWFRPCAK